MAPDEKVLAAMDCFHRYYRLCQAGPEGSARTGRYEAWLDYRKAILRRDEFRCHRCGRQRADAELKVRPVRSEGEGVRAGGRLDRLAPDNLVSVCSFCEESVVTVTSG